MPKRFVRILISAIVIVHLFIISVAILAHRGTSYIHDDFLSSIAFYTALGNWRLDTNCLPIASANRLSEIVQVEWHEQSAQADQWRTNPSNLSRGLGRTALELSRSERFEQLWLQQLSGLIAFDNDEGVIQMLMGLKPVLRSSSENGIDQLRITVAPQLSIEQFEEVQANDSKAKLPEALQPRVAFSAMIIDLGDGQLSFLPQLEKHRASKSTSSAEQLHAVGETLP